jgi:hypothetical protein
MQPAGTRLTTTRQQGHVTHSCIRNHSRTWPGGLPATVAGPVRAALPLDGGITQAFTVPE